MKIPRDISAKDLSKALSKHGYQVSRQKRSHIRLTKDTATGVHHVTIPNHDPLKLGTLAEILNQVSLYLGISKEEILNS